MKRTLRGLAVGVAVVLASLALPAVGASADAPPAPTVPVPGWYTMQSNYNGYIPSVRGWSITWQVPQVMNTTTAVGVIGQWFYALETGIYYTPDSGWWVYYYGDDNGTAENNAACVDIWFNGSGQSVGGGCSALKSFAVGNQVTFVYEYCAANHAFNVNGPFICAYVDLLDGAGKRFLASDAPGTVEMYAHDVETFGDSGDPEPLISCVEPIKMVEQKVKFGTGAYQSMTGVQWDFHEAEDVNTLYDFQNANLSATPARWETCTPSGPICVPTYWRTSIAYTNPQTVAWNRHVWRAKWYTQGEVPGTGAAWQDLGSC